MKFESTLERKSKECIEHIEEALKDGYENKLLDEVFNLITSSDRATGCMQARAVDIAETIQPSITVRDLKLATNMMCAMASQLVLNLADEGLININKKEV